MKEDDFFANVADSDAIIEGKDLYEPQPQELLHKIIPEHSLPVESEHYSTIRTQEELDIALKVLRKKTLPFLEQHSPTLESFRKRQPIDKFDWRIETADDQADFVGNVLQGNGIWQSVSIPHYGPPQGKATTFYRTELEVSADNIAIGSTFLCFKGVDYKAHVYVNGAYAGSHEGFFSPFEFDVSKWVKEGRNLIVIRVDNDAICMGNSPWGNPEWEGDKLYAATGPGWDTPEGWHHCPPGMGIYQNVYMEHRPVLFIHDVFVRPLLDEKKAEIWIEIFNTTQVSRYLKVDFQIHGRNFKEDNIASGLMEPTVKQKPGLGDMIKPDDNKILRMECGSGVNYFKFILDLKDPRLWSLEEPWLYQLHARLQDTENRVIDTAEQHFGMRSFISDETCAPKGRLYFNNEPIRLRGANTMGHLQQCVITKDWDQLIDDILLAKLCNLNFFRTTQRPVQPEIYQHFDMLGILSQADYPLFGNLRRNQFDESHRQVREMERLLRKHPSVVIISYMNEPFPNGASKPHRNLDFIEQREWYAIADTIVRQCNPDRVIKAVDGDYDPPSPGISDRHCYNLWYGNHGIDFGKLHRGYWQSSKKDWVHGCGEFGVEALDTPKLMKENYPGNWLKAVDNEGNWTPEYVGGNQTYRFHHLWYETPRGGMDSWVKKSHDFQKLSLRHIGEAFRRDNQMVTCAIHLFIDAFPSSWMKTIIDSDRKVKGGFFGLREAFAPVAVSIRLDRFSWYVGESISAEAWVANDTNRCLKNWLLHYSVSNESGKLLSSGSSETIIDSCQALYQGDICYHLSEQLNKREKVKITLTLIDETGHVVHQCEQDLLVFPKPVISDLQVFHLFPEESKSTSGVLEFMGAKSCHAIDNANVILADADSFLQYEQEGILSAVKQGARLVLFSLPEGKHDIAGHLLTVLPTGMAERHFVSRDSNHACVSSFKEDDLRFWYNQKLDNISPFYNSCILPESYINPILLTGTGNSGFGGTHEWTDALVAGDIAYGNGVIRFCQIAMSEWIAENGSAGLLTKELLSRS
jgi:hypothetical protein